MGKADYRKQFCESCVSQSQCGYYRDNEGKFCPLLYYYDKGYEQAEKDFALTAEDIRLIDSMVAKFAAEHGEWPYRKDHYEEVLRRFNDLKSKEE